MEFCFEKIMATLNEILNEKESPICRMFCGFLVSVETAFIPSVEEI